MAEPTPTQASPDLTRKVTAALGEMQFNLIAMADERDRLARELQVAKMKIAALESEVEAAKGKGKKEPAKP